LTDGRQCVIDAIQFDGRWEPGTSANMKHNFQSEGFGVRLRPVVMEDAAFIVWLRNLQHAKGHIGDSATDVASQHAWMEAYFKRPGDYYLLIETLGGSPVGTYGFWDLRENSAEAGRWIIHPEVPAAIPSAILCLDLAFEQLKLAYLRLKTVSTNKLVLSLNRKFGMRQTHTEKAIQMIGGQPVDLINFTLSPPDWAKARESLVPLAHLAERQVAEWDRNQNANSPVAGKA
jgi:RimJ/RimL family protein N-acetyltransferase